MMRIIMISSSGKIGGGPSHIFSLVNSMPKEIKVYLAMPENDRILKYTRNLNNFNNEDFFSITERKLNLLELVNLIKFIRINKINIIHSHGKGAGLIARIVRFFTNTYHVHTYHGIHLKCHNFFIRKIYILYENIFKTFDTKRVFVSSSEKEYAITSGIKSNSNNIVIPNGVQIKEKLQKDEERIIRKKIREKLNIKFNTICLITLARLVEQKNLFELIKISKLCPNQKFLILGDGELKNNLNNFIIEKNISNVLMLGNVENVFDYLIASDIYLSTSLYEGFPIAILEAMSSKLPIIASNVIGNIDTIIHDKSGYFYEIGNLKIAKKYIDQLSNKKSLRLSIGENALKRQREFFSKSLMLKRHLNMYREILKL